MKPIKWMLGTGLLGMLLASVSPTWGMLNNGFDTDMVYAIKSSDTPDENGKIQLYDKWGLSTQNSTWAHDSGYRTLTFTFGGCNDTRLFVAARVGDPLTDLRIDELDSTGAVVNSVLLGGTLGATIGTHADMGSLRFNPVRNSLCLSVNPDTGDNANPVEVYEVNLALDTLMGTYTGQNVWEFRPGMTVNFYTGDLYLTSRDMGQASIPAADDQWTGNIIKIEIPSGTVTTLVDGARYAANNNTCDDGEEPPCTRYDEDDDENYLCPGDGIVYRGTRNNIGDQPREETIIINKNPNAAAHKTFEFYLNRTENGDLKRMKEANHGVYDRGWNMQLDWLTGEIYVAELRGPENGVCRITRRNHQHVAAGSNNRHYTDVATPPGFARIYSYYGDVDPEDVKSCGDTYYNSEQYTSELGYTARLLSSIRQGELVEETPGDDGAYDGLAWYINDLGVDNTYKTKWVVRPQNNPPDGAVAFIEPGIGATAVGRVKVIKTKGANPGGNLIIQENSGLGARYHWSDDHSNNTYDGRIMECERDASNIDPARADQKYHILRLTVQDVGDPPRGQAGSNPSRTIRLYFDENPTPVIELTDAVEVFNTLNDYLGFGSDHGTAQQQIYFDYVRLTDAGAYAPGEEVACLGESLVIPQGNEPIGACCINAITCEEMTALECQAQDGWWRGGNRVCSEIDDCEEGFPCHAPFADVDNDDDVDQDDFAVFQLCYTGADLGPIPIQPSYCSCLDRGDDDGNNYYSQDDDIDQFDYDAFQDCASGPGIPADPGCELPPEPE